MSDAMLGAMEPRAVVTLGADEAAARPDAIGEMFNGTLGGVVLRAALPAARLVEAVAHLAHDDAGLPRVHVLPFRGWLLGRPLVASQSGLGAYLDDAARFRDGCARLLALDLETHLQRLFGAIAGGREVAVPVEGGRRYLPAGFRALVDGDALPLHYENSTFDNPCMAQLRPMLDQRTLMSFYIQAQVARGGGELRLYGVDCTGDNSRLIERLGGDAPARPWFEARGFVAPRLEVGDMLVFDGGRYYHEVTPVEGGPRWTLGGFLALTHDHDAVRFWS